ncbi:MAG: hypothetical protein ACTSXG_03345 [Alphaproteobacteria bacterium]
MPSFITNFLLVLTLSACVKYAIATDQQEKNDEPPIVVRFFTAQTIDELKGTVYTPLKSFVESLEKSINTRSEGCLGHHIHVLAKKGGVSLGTANSRTARH